MSTFLNLIMIFNLCFRSHISHCSACHQGQAKVTDGFLTMFTDFLGFLVATDLYHHHVNKKLLIMFMQYLSENGLSAANIANSMAGIRTQCIINEIDATPFAHE